MSRFNKIEQYGSKRILKDSEGRVVLEEAMPSSDLLYVKEARPGDSRDFGTFVTKAQLEDLLNVTIIEKRDLPKAGPASKYVDADFKVGVVNYKNSDDPEELRKSAYRLLAAANRIERHRANEKADAERKEAERVAEKARLKALAEEGKKRREIGNLKDALLDEGLRDAAIYHAERLYEAGVRKV